MRMQSSFAKVGTLSRFLDTKMKSSSGQYWYFVCVFGYEDAELILPKFVFCLDFFVYEDAKLIKPKLVYIYFVWVYVWGFGYKEAHLILTKLELFLGFGI